MKILNTFFGQVLRKGDVDFNSYGAREAITRLNVDLTTAQGGVISGLEVFTSIDGLSILIQPGIFYSSGMFSPNNNQGGGERGQVYTTQSFTGLPSTAPIANQPSYLVVYVKIANQNSNPDPTQLQTTTTSVNIQTGQNVPTQNYPVGTIAISNPVLASQIGTFNGVTLAVLQVDYVGTSQISSNGTVQSIDTTKRQDYIIGGAVDVANQEILAAAIPNNFITNRMIGSGQVTGFNFANGTIDSAAIAQWDGSADVATSGDGIASDHLKNGAVTLAKINYASGLNDFSERNYVLNSSFEVSQTTYTSWNFTGTSNATSATVVSNSTLAQFGNNSVLLQGGSTGNPAVSTSLNLNQNVNFSEPIEGQNLTAYFYVNLASNLSGGDNINGVLSFYANPTDAASNVNIIGTNVFSTLTSGNSFSNGSYIQMQTSSPVVAPSNTTVVNIAISGQFANPAVYVDGVYLGLTSITPKFSVALEEQLNKNINASNITFGTLQGNLIAQGSITPNLIPLAAGGTYGRNNGGIVGTQIANQTITATNIANNTIGTAQLVAGIIQTVPPGAVLMFIPDAITIAANITANPGQNGCPQGMSYVSAMEGMLPVGIMNTSATNPGGYSGPQTPGTVFGNKIIATANNIAQITTDGHTHLVDNTSADLSNVNHGNTGFDYGNPTYPATDSIQLPFITVLWCQQN